MGRFRLVNESIVANPNYPLVLGVEVEGECEVRGNVVSGVATISCELELHKHDGGTNMLRVTNRPVNTEKAVTNGSTDLPLAVRTSIANLMPTSVEYDFRAMLYMIGREMARVCETDVRLTDSCEIYPVTTRNQESTDNIRKDKE